MNTDDTVRRCATGTHKLNVPDFRETHNVHVLGLQDACKVFILQ